MDKILKKINDIKPITYYYEGCLYIGTYENQQVFFFHQEDDFEAATKDEQVAINLINDINQQMTIDINDLGRY